MTEEKLGEESRRINCIDPEGIAIVVTGVRDIFPAAKGVRFGPWIYQTEDGRTVRAGAREGDYVLMPGNIPLTTIDPQESADD